MPLLPMVNFLPMMVIGLVTRVTILMLLRKNLKAYKSQPVVLIVESDSIATMVTNLDSTPACCDLERYYIDGHGYIIQKFGILPHVAMYLGILDTFFCLGWDDNRQKAGKVYS